MSARILAFGDLHLGASDRLDDQEAVLNRIVDLALERNVGAVCFAGDATHHRSTIQEVAVFQRGLARLNLERIPVLIIPGNHDVSTMDVESTVEVAAGGFKWCQVARRPGLLSFVSDVAVFALPWCPTSAIAALDPTGQVDDVVRQAQEILMDVAHGLRASHEGPAVLLLHWSLAGSVTPTGALVDEFREVILPTHELSEMGWDLVIASHIHTPGHLTENVLYTGSAATVDFGEEHAEHGVWIVEVGDAPATTEFVPIEDRRFVTIGKDDVLSDGSLDGAIVRVRYEATADEERHIDHALIVQNVLAAGAHRVAGIQPTITRADGTRAEITEDVSVDEAFTTWLAGQDVDLAQIERVGAAHHEIREAVAR